MPCHGKTIIYGWPSRSTTWPWQQRLICHTAGAAHSNTKIPVATACCRASILCSEKNSQRAVSENGGMLVVAADAIAPGSLTNALSNSIEDHHVFCIFHKATYV